MHDDPKPDEVRRAREIKATLWLALALVCGAVLLTMCGCASEPIVKTVYEPYPVPVTVPCQKPAVPLPPAEPVIPEGASEADAILILERAWETMRAWGLDVYQLFLDMPGETVEPGSTPPPS